MTRPLVFDIPYARNNQFIGQKIVLESIHKRLVEEAREGFTAAHVLYGLGGIGKTQIAMEYAHRHKTEFDVVCWLRAENYKTLVSSYVTLSNKRAFKSVSNLDFDGEKDHEKIAANIREWFEDTEIRWLLIFDNADIEIDQAAKTSSAETLITKLLSWFNKTGVEERSLNRDISTLIPRGSQGSILITSRDRSMDGEIASSGTEVREMSEDDAVEFLLKCSRVSSNEFAQAVVLVRALGYHPLAIEQAGGVIRNGGMSIASYHSLFDSNKTEALTKGLPRASYYKETITKTWKTSFDAIDVADPFASKILRFAAFLDGKVIQRELFIRGFPMLSSHWGVSNVTEWEISRSFSVILSHSLMHPIPLDESFEMHLLVQQVIRDEICDRSADWFRATLQMVVIHFPGSRGGDFSNGLKYLSQARQCADHAERLNVKDSNVQYLLESMGEYLIDSYQNVEAIASYGRLVNIFDGENEIDRIKSGRALLGMGTAYISLHSFEDAKSFLERAFNLYCKEFGEDSVEVAEVMSHLAEASTGVGHWEQAISLQERVIKIYSREHGNDHISSADAILGLGNTYFFMGKYREAIP